MTTSRFLVTGARQLVPMEDSDHQLHCYEACITEVDLARNEIVRQYVEESFDPAIYCDAYSFSFRGGKLEDGLLHTCTQTEVIDFSLAEFRVTGRWSHRLFNDLHYAAPLGGLTYVASTGLDAVAIVLDNGEVTLLSAAGEELPDTSLDYRSVSTKPHRSHPNFLFFLEGQPWVTRFVQRDAVCLSDPTQRIAIDAEKPHDGLIRGDRIYFTSVNGVVSVFDRYTLELVETHDLNLSYRGKVLGWCRGLEVVDHHLYVGFTALRRTKEKKNINYVRNLFKEKLPTRIVTYDMQSARIVGELAFDPRDLGFLFSIFALHNE